MVYFKKNGNQDSPYTYGNKDSSTNDQLNSIIYKI